jgi:alpha-L-fucosidase 2
MQNIYEYFEFTGDKKYFAEHIYPIMRESVRFYTQWLIYDDKQKRLVSSPTYSPEHGPVTIGNTYEQSLIEQLYNDFITASEALGTDEELRNIVKNQVVQLKPFSVSKKTGLLKEWFEEDDDNFDHSKTQKNHRHISHLLGLYPGKAINSHTPELMTAAINTLNDRGDESTGWSRAYKLNLWARVKDGNRAYSILQGLLRGCTFDNLFDFHPPFQLDGNFGGSAGIAEMLIQSHEGYIELLPAAPDAWRNGAFTGLCARHGFVIDAKWENFNPTAVTIKSTVGGVCRIKSNCEAILCDGKSVPMLSNDGIVSFETLPDSVYTFVF